MAPLGFCPQAPGRRYLTAKMQQPRILLVVGGGIAAYKSCELVRLIRKGGGEVTCVLTEGGSQFVTPMSLAALSGNQVYTSLWDLKNEAEIGHIQLSRDADLVVVCPATADLLAKMAAGICDDLATTLILATDKPVLAVPAMNVRMWQHAATQRNLAWLHQAGVRIMQPDEGPMACGEFGPGRLPEPEMVWLEIADLLGVDPGEAGPREVADYLEALEPEEEPEEQAQDGKVGGLAGLLASIIPRSTPRRIQEEEVSYAEETPPGEAVQPPLPEDFEFPEAGELPPPDLAAGPLLATKGGAKSAPLADHGSGAKFDPLEGQPAFETEPEHRPLYGRHVLVTAGPTHEPIDPVRYIANRSSGKQGYAIAAAAAAAGARVTLVSGPVTLATPPGVDRIDVESAEEMAAEVKAALPVDVAVMVAAVADWRTREYVQDKIKKRGSAPPALLLTENPDILATVAASPQRPQLVVGFAAETEDVVTNATLKRKNKGVDWIVANDVSGDVMGGDNNLVHLVSESGVEDWEAMTKQDVAHRLVERIAENLNG